MALWYTVAQREKVRYVSESSGTRLKLSGRHHPTFILLKQQGGRCSASSFQSFSGPVHKALAHMERPCTTWLTSLHEFLQNTCSKASAVAAHGGSWSTDHWKAFLVHKRKNRPTLARFEDSITGHQIDALHRPAKSDVC